MEIVKKYYQVEHEHMFGVPSDSDYELIKGFLKSPDIQKEEIFVYPVCLCDNKIDRDNEIFSEKALHSICSLVVGKAGIKNHDWSSDNIHSRIYKAEIEQIEDSISVVAYAYTVATDSTKGLIQDIKSGLLKEVSLGFSAVSYKELGNKAREIEDVSDVFEWSFVAVPAQPGAGVVKEFNNDKGVNTMDFEARVKELETEINLKSLRVKELEEDLEVKETKIKELQDAVIESAINSAVSSALEGLKPKSEKAAELVDSLVRSMVSLSDDGEAQGVEEAKACMKSDYGFLFEDEPKEEPEVEEKEEDEDEDVTVKNYAVIAENIVKKSKKLDFTYIPNKN